MAGGRITAGVIQQGGARQPRWQNNIGLARVFVDDGDDSIKINGSDGTALSKDNYGWVTLPSVTSGRLTTFAVTADVVIPLAGAHWGAGGKGNLTDQKLVVYALNNNGSLVWGVGTLSQVNLVLDADDSATPSSVTEAAHVLVSSALSADAQALMVGWFKADFTDTGGTSEDIWLIGVAGDEDINLGYEDIPIYASFESTTAQGFANGSATVVDYEDKVKDSHNAVTVGSSWNFKAPLTGWYQFNAMVEMGALAGWAVNEQINLRIRDDGADVWEYAEAMHLSHAGITKQALSGAIYADKGSALDIELQQNNGATLTSTATALTNKISIHFVGK